MRPSPVAPYALAWRLYAVGRRERASCGPTTHRLLIPTMETARATTSGPAPGRIAEEDSMAFSGQVLDNPISGERFIFHQFANAGDEPAVVRVRVEPALRMEQLYETVAALASEGRTLRSGMPKPLDLAIFMREFEQEVRAPVAPGLVRAVMAPLAWMAMRRGLDQRYRSLPGLAARRPAPTHPGAGRVAGTRPGPARRGPGLGPQGRPGASA